MPHETVEDNHPALQGIAEWESWRYNPNSRFYHPQALGVDEAAEERLP